jgi:hypothetical protein
MSHTTHQPSGNRPDRARPGRGRRTSQRRISVRGVRRDPPDLRKLSRAVITLALAEAEAERDAQAHAQAANESNLPSRSADVGGPV